MEKIDILRINCDVLEFFSKREQNLPKLRSYVINLKNLEKKNELSFRIKNKIKQEIILLKKLIKDIKNNISKNYYIMDSLPIINQYKKNLKVPIKLNFMGKLENKNYKKKKSLENKFLEICNRFKLLTKNQIILQKLTIFCIKCNNYKNFTIDNNHYICAECGLEFFEIKNLFSYNAVNRVNVTSKYTYDRKIHFRDCVNQYQAKQNTIITEKLYTYLIDKIKAHGLVKKDAKLPFSNITKEQIFLFLKNGKFSKYYDDLTLIHYKLTGIKPPNISHIESKLIADFDILTTLYDIKFRKDITFTRKNFINTQYVLYQLLRKYNFPCKSSDFNILKTVERKTFHDNICRQLFTELKWNFKAIF